MIQVGNMVEWDFDTSPPDDAGSRESTAAYVDFHRLPTKGPFPVVHVNYPYVTFEYSIDIEGESFPMLSGGACEWRFKKVEEQ